jgi:hypothetical protein
MSGVFGHAREKFWRVRGDLIALFRRAATEFIQLGRRYLGEKLAVGCRRNGAADSLT